LIKKKRKKW